MPIAVPPPDMDSATSAPVRSAFLTAVRLMGAGRASLLLRSDRDPNLFVAAAVGIEPDVLPTIQVQPGQGVAGVVAERGVALFGMAGDHTFLSAPVTTDRGIEGVLNLTNRSGGREYTPDEIEDAQSVAGMIGQILQFSRQAARDVVSGLPNRAAFTEALDRELARFRRTGQPLTVVFVDLDNLKSINDTEGHARGDEAIRGVAEALQNVLRPYDLATRYGGDEFALLVPGGTEEDSSLPDRIMASVTELDRTRGLGASVSLGVARVPQDGVTADAVLKAADERMYQNKRAKPGRR